MGFTTLAFKWALPAVEVYGMEHYFCLEGVETCWPQGRVNGRGFFCTGHLYFWVSSQHVEFSELEVVALAIRKNGVSPK